MVTLNLRANTVTRADRVGPGLVVRSTVRLPPAVLRRLAKRAHAEGVKVKVVTR